MFVVIECTLSTEFIVQRTYLERFSFHFEKRPLCSTESVVVF